MSRYYCIAWNSYASELHLYSKAFRWIPFFKKITISLHAAYIRASVIRFTAQFDWHNFQFFYSRQPLSWRGFSESDSPKRIWVLLLYPLAQIQNLEHHHVCEHYHQTLACFVYHIIFDDDDDDVWTWNDGDRYIFPGKTKITAKLRFILLFTLRNPTCMTLLRFPCLDWKKQYCCVHYNNCAQAFNYLSYMYGILATGAIQRRCIIYNATSRGSSWLLLLLL